MDDARFQGPFRGQLCQPPAPVSVPVPRPPVPSYWKALGFGLLVALPGGLLSGLAAFMGGPVLGWLAVLLLGYCVGAVVANSGRQGDFRFGVLATLLALLGTSLARLEACWCVTLIQLGVLPHVPTFHPEAVGLFLAAAWHWDDLPDCYVPVYSVAMPNVSGCHFTSVSPCPRSRSASASPSGNSITLAGR